MVRISDGRMSGTAFGTIVLHVTPEAAVGGPLALGAQRRPHPPEREPRARSSLLVSRRGTGATRARRDRSRRRAPSAATASCSCKAVTQADQGVDFDFLRAAQFVEKVPRPR